MEFLVNRKTDVVVGLTHEDTWSKTLKRSMRVLHGISRIEKQLLKVKFSKDEARKPIRYSRRENH